MNQLSDLNPREQFLLKFDDPAITLEQVLQWQSIVEEYVQGNLKVHSFINKHLQRLIQLMTIEGHQQDTLRSYLFPQVSAQLLSSGHPTMNLLLLTPVNSSLNSEPLCRVLDYFQGTPNNILSGYVIKVITTVYHHEPVKTQDFIIKRRYAPEMIKFLSSRSVGDFLVTLIAIEDDRILTYYLKERNDLLNYMADTYAAGTLGLDQLAHLGIALCELLDKLWCQKNKESGEFAASILRISQMILNNNNNLIQHNSDLLPLVVEKLSSKGKDAPFLLKQCASKIIYVLSTYQPQVWISTSGKETARFSKQNLKLLIALSTIITSNYDLVAEILQNSGCFAMLLDLMAKYQLNNMVHIEVGKIFKAAFSHDAPLTYSAIVENGQLLIKVNEMVFSTEASNTQSTKGYIGIMVDILTTFRGCINSSRFFGQLLKTHPDFVRTLNQYLNEKNQKKSINLAGCRLQQGYTVPDYDQNTLKQKYKAFFEAEKIQKDPRFGQNKQALNEIFNELQVTKQWGLRAEENRSY